MTILGIADEERPALTIPGAVDFGPGNRPDVVLSAGDLDFGYVSAVADAFDVPCVMVPGNHDPSLGGFTLTGTGWLRAGRHDRWPGPVGAWTADGDVVEVAGLRIGGLGGCGRYSDGPNQWTGAQARRRARRVERASRRSGGIDVLLTHAPGSRGAGDDAAHRALPAVDRLLHRLRPALHLHGHAHLHGDARPVFTGPSGGESPTLTVNTVGWTLSRIHRAGASDTAPRAELLLKGR